ncbi:cupin domain-containing protein [Lelliottia sp. V106_10]|uniref:cupin domain-containing protein n=1 Tax=Lelliottia wanjuensis TaxID=3050585 RepID=UPI0025513531|nr:MULTISPECIES: cupin domain-containing protein [unclassified Lelliottia]MDK9356596.1 cupin domain-containing protein [Lelliottia sp. V106_16]MDK9372648.1 cupin domain-containing protein [Lelliottia sp. V106_10]MDK9599452.1 cupin domain-containing protein [Lelliottia sp. V106_5]
MKASIAGVVANLPEIWRSRVLGTVGNASIKVIKMGGEGIPSEVHDDFDELLLVLDGELPLVVAGEQFTLQTGEYCFVPRGASHSVPEGSFGVLLLVDVGQGKPAAP